MKKHIHTSSIVWNFFREFFKNKWFIWGVLAAISAHTFSSFDTYFVSLIVDRLRLFLSGETNADIYTPFYWLIGTGALTWLFHRIYERMIWLSQTQIAQHVYVRVFSYIHHHSHQYFSDNFAGSIFKRLSRYVRTFEDFSDLLIYQITPMLIHLIVTLVFIVSFSPSAGLIVVVYVLLFCIISFLLVRWQHPLVDRHDRLDSAFSGYVTDTIGNHSTILSFGRFRTELEKFQEKCRITYEALYDSWKRGNIMSWVLGIIAYVNYWIITGFALHMALRGEIVFATFLIINTYNGNLTDRLWSISSVFKTFGKITADAREGYEILQTPHSIIDRKNAKILSADKGAILFRDVSFWYGEEEIFSHLNLSIKPYEKIGIVGLSWSGKSTLTKILMRLYEIQKGDILIDGQSIQHVTQESLHRSIALVPQDTILFHRSLEENIRYPQPDISSDLFHKYCQIAHCDTFITKLPKWYKTLVWERGIKLSGWERQRVAIARALIAETPIIVFDEATSALDSESEKYIQEAMFDAIEGKTALVIAHRLSTIVHLDRILVFDGWKIIEDGSHAELMKQWGTYAKLWTIQSGEFRE